MHVKLTDQIKRDVGNRIDAMYRRQIDDAQSWYKYIPPVEFDALVLASVYSDELRKKIEDLGEACFDRVKSLSVKLHYVVNGSNHTTHYTLRFVEDTFIPNKWMNSYSDGIRICRDPQISEALAKRHEDSRRAVQARDEFKTKVVEMMNKASSVNEIIRLWPAFEDLVDDTTKERLHRKVARNKSDREALEVNTNELSVHMLKAKILA